VAEELDPGLVVDVRVHGEHVEVELRGELDIATVPHAQRSLDGALAAGGHDVILDLTAVTFVDARGLGFLTTAFRNDASIRMRVSPRLRRLLEITDLDQHLPIDEPD
jgi:anti-anti-sigma factor